MEYIDIFLIGLHNSCSVMNLVHGWLSCSSLPVHFRWKIPWENFRLVDCDQPQARWLVCDVSCALRQFNWWTVDTVIVT